MAQPLRSCKTHPAAAAGWSCTQCHALLCPKCTASKRAQTVQYPVCTLCGGAAAPLRVARTERPYTQRLKGVWRYPLSPAGLITIGAAGLIVYLLSFLGGRGAAIGLAIVWSYVFTLIRRTANGDDSLDPPDFTDFSDIATPGFRGALATAVLWVPAALYLNFAYGSVEDTLDAAMESSVTSMPGGASLGGEEPADLGTLLDHEAAKTRALDEARRLMDSESARVEELDEEVARLESEEVEDSGDGFDEEAEGEGASAAGTEGADGSDAEHREGSDEAREAREPRTPAAPRSPWTDPVLYLLVVFGVLWMPVAILSSAAGGSALQMLNPIRPIIFAKRIPHEYAVAVGAFALVALGGALLSVFGHLLQLLPIPLVPGWIAASLGVYPPLVAGRVLGLLLVVRGAELGYLREDEMWEEALPGAEPQGQLPAAFRGPADAPPAQEEGAPEQAEQAEPAAPPRRRHAPIELDEEPPAVAPPAPRPPPAVRVMGMQGLESAAPAAAAVGVAAGAAARSATPQAPAPQTATAAPRPPASAQAAPRPTGPAGTRPGPAATQPGAASTAAERLRAAVQAQALAEALQLYPTALREPGAALGADCHFAVGRYAATQGQYPLAVQALRTACTVQPAGPLAAQSLVLMARVLGERMGDAAGAQRVYEHVVRHYPDSEGARFARGRLTPPTA